MIWVFPMAGRGSRVANLGEFKPFIKVCGREIVSWLLSGVRSSISEGDQLVFTTTKHFEEKFSVSGRMKEILKQYGLSNHMEVFIAPDTPPGPAASVYLAADVLRCSDPVAVINTDQFIYFKMPVISPQSGYLPVYAEFSGKSSYVGISNGLITRVVEKRPISHIASGGVYIVSDGEALVRAIEQQFKEELVTNGEYYVGPALNYLIDWGFQLRPLSIHAKYDLGSESGINVFSEFAENF